MTRMRCGICILLCWLLTAPPGFGQGRLNLEIVEGDSVINDTRQGSAHQVVVRVTDEAGQAAPGVAVAFTLPTQGATATFADGSKTLVTVSDGQGLASARVQNPTGAGAMEIRVNASHQGRMGTARLSQVNMLVPSAQKTGGSGKWIALALLMGVGAGGAGFALTRSKAKATGPLTVTAPIGLTPGNAGIGPPQ